MAQSFKTGITVDDAAAASSQAIATNVNADTHNRLTIDAGGKITWGSGSATGDTTLYRDSANTLKTDDAFTAASLAVTGAFTLPSSDGSADQILVTDGAGNVTWENNTASASAAGSDGQVQYNNGGATGGAGALYYDDSNARVGINTTSPDDVLHVVGDVTIEFSDDGALAQPEVTLHRESATPADGDYLGQLKFAGKNDAGQTVNYAKITGKISDVTDTTEDGLIEIATVKAGSQNIGYRLTSTDLKLINGTGLQVDGDTGIGTTAPDFKLHVNGANANNIILAESTDATARVNMMDNSTTSNVHVGIGAIGNDMSMWAGNIRQMTIEAGGNVGIGNTSPTQKLDVSGTVTATGLAVTGEFTLPTADGSANQVLVTDGLGSVSWSDNNATVSPAGSDGQIQYNNGGALGGASQLYFDDSTARLGVGTSSPGGEIEISADSPTLRFTDTDTDLTDNEITGAIEFYGSDTDDVGLAAYIHADADGTAGAMQLRFGTGTAGFASDRMTIQADGNVGIGTTSPAHSLSFGSPADGTRSLALWENGTAFYGLGNDTNRLAFYASNSAGTAERMIINSDGKVGIGTTAPDQELHVEGGIKYVTPSGGNGHLAWTNGSNYITADDDAFTYFRSYDSVADSYSTFAAFDHANERLGIGTTAPSIPLHVVRNASSEVVRLQNNNAENQGPYISLYDLNSRIGYMGFPNNDDLHLKNESSAGRIYLSTNNATRVTVDQNGNVGIGDTGPENALHVNRTGYNPSANDDAALRVEGNYGGGIVMSEGSARMGIYAPGGNTFQVRTGQTASGGGTIGISQDTSGNVGIKDSTPSYELDVAGQIRATSNIRGGAFLMGTSDDGLKAVTGTYGSVQTTGTGAGNYEGYSINGHFVFMSNSTEACGIYNDVDNRWMFLSDNDSYVRVYDSRTGITVGGNPATTTGGGSGGNGWVGINNECGGFSGTACVISTQTVAGTTLKRLGFSTSSYEYKTGIEDFNMSDEAFMSLRPITFHPDNQYVDQSGEVTEIVGGHTIVPDPEEAGQTEGLMPLRRAGFGLEDLYDREDTMILASEYSPDPNALIALLVKKLQETMDRVTELEAAAA